MIKLPLRRFSPQLKKARDLPQGQALLVILLVMAVGLTIGLAVTSRTVTDIEISEKTEEAARAFSAAEAGVEEALVTAGFGELPSGEFEGGVSYTTRKDPLGEEKTYLFPSVENNETKTLWLAEYPDTESYAEDSLILYWGDFDSSENPSLEVIVYYLDGGNYKTWRYALNPIDRGDGFCQPDLAGDTCDKVLDFDQFGPHSIGSQEASYKATIELPGGPNVVLLFARLRLLYSDESQVLGAEAVGDSIILPSQGVKITSTGTAGASTRKVEVIREHPAPSEIFDFLLYSGTDLEK